MIRNFLRELIGRTQRIIRRFDTRFSFTNRQSISQDVGNVSYAYWDKVFHGKAEGLEISGLLIKPLVNKVAAWMMSSPPRVQFKKREQTVFVATWLEENMNALLDGIRSSLKLGDGFVFVNSDMSLEVISPQSVFPLVDPDDYSKIIGWRILREYPNPDDMTSRHIIREELTQSARGYHRTRIVEDENGKEISRERFFLPISQIPLIHIPNNRSENERYGRPEGEMLVELLHRYGESLDAALDGNLRQGRPTPVFSKLGSQRELDAFWEHHGTRVTNTLSDGTVETYYVIDFDADRAITLGGDANFSWESPGSASKDTETLLGLLFYIYVQHSEMPEWVLGNAITGSRASAEVQVDPLTKFITLKRLAAATWLKPLIRLILEMKSLSDIAVTLEADEKFSIIWPVLTRKDGQLTLQAIQWAYGQRLIDRETAISHLPLDIPDPDAVLDAAMTEDRPDVAIEDATSTETGGIERDDPKTNNNGNRNGPDRSTETLKFDEFPIVIY